MRRSLFVSHDKDNDCSAVEGKRHMTHKERFQTACKDWASGRVPIDYHAEAPGIEEHSMRYCGVETEAEMLDILGCDFYYLSCRDISQNEGCLPIYRGPQLPHTAGARTCPFWHRMDPRRLRGQIPDRRGG